MKHTKHMKHMKCKSRFFGKTVFFLKEFWNCNCEMHLQLLVVLLLFRERGNHRLRTMGRAPLGLGD